MAVRPLKIFTLLSLAILCAWPVHACFGPKLFLGVPDDLRGQILTSLVAIYVKEKTGIETTRVSLSGKDPLDEIRAETIDFAFTTQLPETEVALLEVKGLPLLVSGPRIINDLQFTTVVPALKRLQQRLKPEHVDEILMQVEADELPMAAARRFLQQERWI